MSDIPVGADLIGLDDLSGKFTATGNGFAERASSLVSRAQQAITDFEDTLDRLHEKAGTSNEDTTTKINSLARDSDGTEWTGQNRLGFDTDKSNYHSAITNAVRTIGEDITGIKTQVREKFSNSIVEMNTQIEGFKDGVTETSATMSRNTAIHRDNVEAAGNVGWTAV